MRGNAVTVYKLPVYQLLDSPLMVENYRMLFFFSCFSGFTESGNKNVGSGVLHNLLLLLLLYLLYFIYSFINFWNICKTTRSNYGKLDPKTGA